jgi:hypothetical protein
MEQDLNLIDDRWDEELNLADYSVLERFLIWAMEYDDNNKVFLSMWSHGDNWKSFCVDKRTNMHLYQFQFAIDNLPRKLDVVGFDSCGMSSVEILYELRGSADYVVASEKKEPNEGWPYDSIIKSLDSGTSAKEVTETLPGEYTKAYSTGRMDPESFSLQLSGLEVNTTATIDPIISDLLAHMENMTNDAVMAARNGCLTFEDKDQIDLLSFCGKIDFDGFNDVISDIVISKSAWNNPSSSYLVQEACGISIYFPPNEVDSEYKKTEFSRSTGWGPFIERYY